MKAAWEMLEEKSMTKFYWAESVRMVVYIHNRISAHGEKCWPSPATNWTNDRAERSRQAKWERAEESMGPKA